MRHVRDRVRGVLVGLAAGDRIGGPINMVIRVAESLLDCRRFDLDHIAARYSQWWREGAFDTGPTAAKVLALAAAGTPIEEASRHVHVESGERTAGCNPAHRAAPLALTPHVAAETLAECAAREAALTHWDPLAGEVSASVVVQPIGSCDDSIPSVRFPNG